MFVLMSLVFAPSPAVRRVSAQQTCGHVVLGECLVPETTKLIHRKPH